MIGLFNTLVWTHAMWLANIRPHQHTVYSTHSDIYIYIYFNSETISFIVRKVRIMAFYDVISIVNTDQKMYMLYNGIVSVAWHGNRQRRT